MTRRGMRRSSSCIASMSFRDYKTGSTQRTSSRTRGNSCPTFARCVSIFCDRPRSLLIGAQQQYVQSLRLLRAEAATASRILATLPDPSSSPSSSASTPIRSPSPAQSDSSSASSTSTHTATPNGHSLSSLRPLTPSHTSGDTRYGAQPHSASTSSIASTATSRTVTPHNADRERERAAAATPGKRNRSGGPRMHANGNGDPSVKSRSRSHSATPAAGARARSVVRQTSFGAPSTESAGAAPSTLALLRASLKGVLQGMPRSRLVLYVVLFVVVPVVSFVFRQRRKRARAAAGAITGGGSINMSTVDAVRRRLRGVDGQGNVVVKLWEEVARAVLDTVRMAGRGLV